MGIREKFLRRFFVKVFLRQKLSELKQDYTQKLKAPGISTEDRESLESEWDANAVEYSDWLKAIESSEMVKKAEKMDVYLDSIPVPPNLPGDMGRPSHFETGPFGDRYVRRESRALLTKAMRERLPAYRKERRELSAIIIQGVVALAALAGSITGIVLAFKK